MCVILYCLSEKQYYPPCTLKCLVLLCINMMFLFVRLDFSFSVVVDGIPRTCEVCGVSISGPDGQFSEGPDQTTMDCSEDLCGEFNLSLRPGTVGESPHYGIATIVRLVCNSLQRCYEQPHLYFHSAPYVLSFTPLDACVHTLRSIQGILLRKNLKK